MNKNLLLLFLIVSNALFSQNIDNTFNPSEINEYDQNYGVLGTGPFNGFVFKDGTALVPKKVDNLYGQQTLIRIDNTGKKVANFYLDYTLYNGLIDNSMKVFANQVSKKFVIVTSDNVIRYFDEDGSLINTFVSPVFVNTTNSNSVQINKVLIQNDNKFLVVGFFDKVNNLDYKNIVRLNFDGSIDTSFNVGTGLNQKAKAVEIQTNNKYVVVGEFTHYNGVVRNFIVRINNDGSLDSSLNIVGFTENNINDIFIQPDGKIITAGPNFVFNSTIVSKGLVRFYSNGVRDTSFNVVFTNGDYPTSIDIQLDGKIITNNLNGNGKPCRLNANGTIDNSFVTDNQYGEVSAKVISLSDNKVIVCGDYQKKVTGLEEIGLTRREIHRLNSNGSIDLSYKPQSGINIIGLEYSVGGPGHGINQVEILPTNNLIIKGRFTSYNDTAVRSLIKTNQNGVLDTSFNFSNTFSLDGIENAKVVKANHTDDKFYLIKNYYNLIPNETRTILKFNENGSMDNTFAPFYGLIASVLTTNDNKIILSGNDSNFQSASQYKLIKLNEDGTVDSSFNSHLFANAVYAIGFQSSGKIIVKSWNNVYRINANGSLDNTFVTTNINGLNGLVVAPDDKIYYTKTTTWSHNKLNCLLENGTPNTSFPEMTNCSLPKFIENSRLLIYDGQGNYGPFDTYLVMNNNGAVLNSFQIKDEYNYPIISDHTIQNCNNLLVFGGFVNANNQYNAGIIRYNLNGFVSTPTPVANTYQNFTSGQTLNDLVVNGQNLTWYTTQCPCTEDSIFKNSNVVNSVLPNTTSLADGMTYFVSQTINGVESNHRLPIKVSQVLSSGSFEKLNFKLFPNPSNGLITIEADFEFEKIKIFNSIGQLVFESNFKNDKQYDLSKLNEGFYNVLILDKKGKNLVNQKLIKN